MDKELIDITDFGQVMELRDYTRDHPWQYNEKLPKQINDLVEELKNLKYQPYSEEKTAKRKKLEEKFNDLGYFHLFDEYACIIEEERKTYNKNKKTLIEIFDLWNNKKISDEEAQKFYKDIKIFEPVEEEYPFDSCYTVNDNNSWFDLRYFINEKYGISSEKIVNFRKALGLIPESKNS